MQRHPVKSSQIHSIGYDPQLRMLEIEFANGGNVYRYSNVSPEMHAELMNSGSIGKFFHAQIRSKPEKHPSLKLEAANGTSAKSEK